MECLKVYTVSCNVRASPCEGEVRGVVFFALFINPRYPDFMSHGRTIARNAMWLLAATTGQKFIAFLTFTLVARLVGAEITGQFFYAISITSVFVVLTDLGMTPVVIREMAQDEESGRSVLRRAIYGKVSLIPIAILASVIYAWAVGVSMTLFLAVTLACFVMSADAVSLLWYGVIRGMRQLRFEAMGMFIGQALTAIVSVTLAFLGAGPIGLVFGLLCGSTWNVFWSIRHARRLCAVSAADGSWSARRLAKAALPFALAGIFVKVYSYADTLMLRQFFGEIAVGYYAVAYKLTYAFQFLPLAFVAALYPGMSAAHASSERETLRKIFTGSLRLMMIVSVPLSAGLSVFAPKIISLLYGRAFLASIVPFMIFPWVLIPIFLDFPIGSLLNATHRAGKKTTAMGITCAINVAANALLVPRFGPTGAAMAGVLSFWTLFFLGLIFVRRDLPSFAWTAWFLARGCAAAGIIWFLAQKFLLPMELYISLPFAVLLTLTVWLVFGLVRREDVRALRGFVKREPVRV